MKNSFIFVSLLAAAGTAATAESATAATTSDTLLKANLKQAICYQDWDSATDLSSLLITSPTITPEYRQHLVDWRHRFIDYSRAKTRFSRIPNCGRVDIQIKPQVQNYPTPQFSG